MKESDNEREVYRRIYLTVEQCFQEVYQRGIGPDGKFDFASISEPNPEDIIRNQRDLEKEAKASLEFEFRRYTG